MATDPAQGTPEPVWVWGLPLAPLTFGQTLDRVEALVKVGAPAYFITANLHYAMLTAGDSRLPPVNRGAAFVLADGMPLVWASRWRPRRLPERVAGSDLVPALCERAALRGFRVFLLGGPPGVAEEAGQRLCARFPGLQVVGVECPPFRELSAEEQAGLLDRVRAARPDLLFLAFGQPKGELWLAAHYRALGVPACVQIGATLDFIAGRVRRAPRWVQRVGLEWAYRIYREPTRLTLRYARNFLFGLKMLTLDALALVPGRRGRNKAMGRG
jgi:N-acetylglucosaminyldiphosphoundecaprenol N-acetyl-beta-D-mannosaminyltransferase